jgi:hypothetical protein
LRGCLGSRAMRVSPSLAASSICQAKGKANARGWLLIFEGGASILFSVSIL